MRRFLRLLPLVAALSLVPAGCGEAERTGTSATEPPPATSGIATTTDEEATPTETDGSAATRPADVLEQFVQAARGEDFEGMWSLLSQGTQQRLGPTVVRFESGAGGDLRRQLARFDPARSDVFLDEPITATFAVAGFGGRVGTGRAPFAAYAAALRREPDGWRLELDGPIGVAPVAPDPGSTVSQRVRVAAEVRSDERVVEAGLWLDGRSVPGRLALTGAGAASMFSQDAPPLVAGPHAVVAFASTRGDASAIAWVFARGDA